MHWTRHKSWRVPVKIRCSRRKKETTKKGNRRGIIIKYMHEIMKTISNVKEKE